MTLPSLNYSSVRSGVLACVIALSLFAASASFVQAQSFIEVGDAGQTPGTVQNTGLTSSPATGQVTIFGSILTPTDADVFRLTLSSPGSFSASTVNTLTSTSGGPGGLDTQLFLFNSSFQPVVANDDDPSGLSLQSTIPVNNGFTFSLAPGVYYIGIALSGNDPVNSNNQLVFQIGLPTSLRGMAAGINPTTWADFNNGTSFAQTGAYQINIFVPESGSTLVLTLAAVGALFVLGRFLTARDSSAS